MLKVSDLMRVRVYMPKRKETADLEALEASRLTLVGLIRQVVFSPSGHEVVGFLLRRPDVGGMIKRDDAFIAIDSFVVGQDGLVASRGEDSFDDRARERLDLDWDHCVLWTGMDAKTTDGKQLGWVNDAAFNPNNGRVDAFYISDGSVGQALVGNLVIPGDMLRGYSDGYMLVDPQAAKLALDGGLAAKAGEGYARAKHEGKKAADRAGKAAGEAVEKGARELGRAIGKAKKASKSKKSGKGMFSAFVEEYKKASK